MLVTERPSKRDIFVAQAMPWPLDSSEVIARMER